MDKEQLERYQKRKEEKDITLFYVFEHPISVNEVHCVWYALAGAPLVALLSVFSTLLSVIVAVSVWAISLGFIPTKTSFPTLVIKWESHYFNLPFTVAYLISLTLLFLQYPYLFFVYP